MNIRNNRMLMSVLGFKRRIARDHVSAYASQAAYFLILSFIPFLLFLTTLVKYTPLTYELITEVLLSVLPENIHPVVQGIVSEVFNRSGAVVPISAVVALWSAGKGLQAITNGLNSIYHVKETRNWLMTRIWSVFYTLLFVIALIGCLILLVLGNRIQLTVSQYVPFLGTIVGKIIGARTSMVFLALICLFLFLYKALPNRKASLKSQVPGALVTAVAWSAFSYGFSLYFTFFTNISNMYGSLTAIIMIMLWMYVCMNIVLYGAEINAYYEKEFRMAQEFARELFDKEDEKEEDRGEEKRTG